MSGASGRKRLSVSPPAAHGTISLTGRSGYAANDAEAASAAAAPSSAKNFFMDLPPMDDWSKRG